MWILDCLALIYILFYPLVSIFIFVGTENLLNLIYFISMIVEKNYKSFVEIMNNIMDVGGK